MTQILDLKSFPKSSEQGASTSDVTPVEAVVVSSSPQSESSELALPSVFDSLLPPPDMSWQVEHHKTAHQWQRHYIAMSVFAVLGGAVALWQSSMLSAAVVLLGLAAWEAYERFHIQTKVAIHEHGVSIDGETIAHVDLASFDVYPLSDGTHELSIQTRSMYPGRLQVPLGDQSPEEVRALMAHYVVAEQHHPHFMTWWLRG